MARTVTTIPHLPKCRKRSRRNPPHCISAVFIIISRLVCIVWSLLMSPLYASLTFGLAAKPAGLVAGRYRCRRPSRPPVKRLIVRALPVRVACLRFDLLFSLLHSKVGPLGAGVNGERPPRKTRTAATRRRPVAYRVVHATTTGDGFAAG